MKTVNIFANYGVLAHEKEIVYHENAISTTSDKITIELPDGWDVSLDIYNSPIITAPWGYSYTVQEIVPAGQSPFIRAVTKSGENYNRKLRVVECV